MKVQELLDTVYQEYHKPEYIFPDPLYIVRKYKKPADREVVGLIAASLAVGKVDLILRAIDQVLNQLGEHPAEAIRQLSYSDLSEIYKNFIYRFFKCTEISSFLYSVGEALRQFGSLEALFEVGYNQGQSLLSAKSMWGQSRILPAISFMCEFLNKFAERKAGILITPPEKGGACKRFNLFLRWMIRKDSIDPGGWNMFSPADLLVPVDTHMFDMASRMGFTRRRNVDMKTVIEITAAFSKLCPHDPVKYDFSLTRLGIHPDLDKSIFEKLII